MVEWEQRGTLRMADRQKLHQVTRGTHPVLDHTVPKHIRQLTMY